MRVVNDNIAFLIHTSVYIYLWSVQNPFSQHFPDKPYTRYVFFSKKETPSKHFFYRTYQCIPTVQQILLVCNTPTNSFCSYRIYYLYIANIVWKRVYYTKIVFHHINVCMDVQCTEFSILLFLLFTYIPSGRALKYHRCHHLFYSENHCIQYNIGFIRYKSFENIITSIFILFYILCCVQRFCTSTLLLLSILFF